MSKSSKIILIGAGGLAGIAVLIAIVAALVLRVNAKPRLEAMASEALGMEVHVSGRLAIGFLPGLHVALTDVHLRKRGAEVASAGEVDLGIEFIPLLRKELRADHIELKRLVIAIERDYDGKLNVDAVSEANGTLPTLAVDKVSVSDASLTYADKQSGKGFEAAGCNLNVSRLRLSPGERADLLKNLSLAAKLACAQFRTKDFTASDLRLSVDGQDGILSFDAITMQLFDGRGSGNVRADFTGSVPMYHVRYHLAQFRLEEFFKNLSQKSIGEGSMDFSATLSLRGRTMTTAALMPTVGGVASLRGDNLRLAIGNLDEKLSRYDSSQSFNLVDVAAFFFAGPLGLAITRGYDFARVFQGAEGTTTIRTLVSEWQVEHGVAQARDVAMATTENRIALKGNLDFVSGRYDEVTVADIDAKGCAKVLQKVHGPFMNPVVEKPNVLGTFTGPTRKLFRQVKSLFGGKCDVFYSGSVAPPK
jgi:AsmA protein